MPKTSPIFTDPFVPVVKIPLNMPDGSRASRSAIIVDPNGQNYEAGVVSEGYNLVSNEVVQDVALQVLNHAGVSYEDGGMIFDGKRYRQRWVIESLSIEARVGDLIRLTVDVFNSYDGSSLFGLAFNAQRLICLNGMMLDFLLGSFRFRHFGQNDFQRETEEAAASILALGTKLGPMAARIGHMTQTQINRESIQSTFKALKLPAGLQAEVFMAVEEDSLWGLYNAFTGVLTKTNTHRADGINRQVGRFLLAGRN